MTVPAAVVIPVYNAGPWVERAIRSVLEHTFPDLAIIAVDDGSTDDSAARVAGFGERVILESRENMGACHARNRGLEIATDLGAKYVLFLDADDYLEGPLVPSSVEIGEANQADMVLSNMHMEYMSGERKLRPRYSGRVDPFEFYRGWLKGDFINPSGIVWSTEFVNAIGRWDTSLSRAQDLEITLRALQCHPRIWKNEHGVAIHTRFNPTSITMDISPKALDSRFRAIRGLIDRARDTEFSEADDLLLDELYRVARDAFQRGHIGVGREVSDYLKTAGYKRHLGSRTHKIASSVLGLELKSKLWRAARLTRLTSQLPFGDRKTG